MIDQREGGWCLVCERGGRRSDTRVDLVREEVSGAALEAIQDSTKQTCQGSASKHAARVLCNWYMPERAIASPGDDPIGGISKFPRLVAAIASADKWTLYNYSADNKSVISVCVLSMWIDAAGKVTGAGFDDRVAATLRHLAEEVTASHLIDYGSARTDDGHLKVLMYTASLQRNLLRLRKEHYTSQEPL